MAAIEHVAERLHETESNDVEMRSPVNEEIRDMKTLSYDMKSNSSNSPTLSMNKFTQSPVEAENKEFQAKFSAIGTSSRPHHSGKKKVVCIFHKKNLISKKFMNIPHDRLLKISSLSKCLAKEPLVRLFSAAKKPLHICMP